MSIVYCVSYAAFIFSGPLSPWLGYGIAATLISTTVGAFVVSLRSSIPFAIAGPDSSTSVATATLVAAFVEWLVANSATDNALEPTLILMALTSALIGLLLCGQGLWVVVGVVDQLRSSGAGNVEMEDHAMLLVRNGHALCARREFLGVLFSTLLALALFDPGVATAQENKEIKLTEKHIQSFMRAYNDMMTV